MRKPIPIPEDEIAVRSILMRLYRSRITGEASYPARFINGESPALEAKGWIERCDDGWRITEAGVKAWAVMSEPVTGHYGRRAWLNELYHHSGKAIQPIYLGPPAKKVFRALVRAGGTLPLAEVEALSDFHPDSRRADGLPTLMRGMYVLLQGDTVHLSVVGEIVAREMGLEVRDASG